MTIEHFDVLVVGAGLSGISAGCHLQRECPGKTYAILEARERSGGTWDLFRYPGIRSDSDMYTLGFSFRPWTESKAIADGPSILRYIRDTAREYGVERHIRYQHRVRAAHWSTDDARWTVEVERAGGDVGRFTCGFLYMCSGYYNYEQGYSPEFAGSADFRGRIVHPQKWSEDVDYAGKRVVIIGSGATAVTLVPEMAKTAAHVTMLQRSPSYVLALPDRDALANFLRRIMPAGWAYGITRWKNVLMAMLVYQLSRRRPQFMRRLLDWGVRKSLGRHYDPKHFTPKYNPWDQRLCFVPNADLFKAIRAGRASVVTDHIERFTGSGIRLRSGSEIEADVIVTATGLNLLAFGGAQLHVDGRAVELNRTLGYKGMMLSDVPNFAVALGYTNASWTLKCDLTCEYMCRLLKHMDRHGFRQVTPRRSGHVEELPFIDFSSGYVQRSIDQFPRQGSKAPWRLYQNYFLDLFSLRFGRLNDGVLEFGGG
jgi:monooxygenase